MTSLVLRASHAAIALMMALAPTTSSWAQACGFKEAFRRADEGGKTTVAVFEGAPVAGLGGVKPLLFISALKVNTDGTRRSYHQIDVTGRACVSDPAQTQCAFNNIRNAYQTPSRPESDFVQVRDAGYPPDATWSLLSGDIIERNKATGKPCITVDGYIVSMTADVAVPGGFSKVGDCDLGKWINAMTIPAIVLPKSTPALPSQFIQRGMTKRSLVIAIGADSAHRTVPGIVGDFGPVNELGEATIAMNRALNGMPDTEEPKHRQDAIARFQAGKTAVLMLPGASNVVARPLTPERIADSGKAAMAALGGADKVIACIRSEVDPSF